MAQITLTIPDAQLDRVLTALALSGGWQAGQTTPTKAAAARQTLISFMRATVANIEERTEMATAEASARDRLRAMPDPGVS